MSKGQTMYVIGDEKMEPRVKKLLDELESVRRQQVQADERIRAIYTALEIMGITVTKQMIRSGYRLNVENAYVQQKPFNNMTLVDACLKILEDHREAGIWLEKDNVEWLLSRGGYSFKGKTATSSVEVTLRRLASKERCEVQKVGGPHGNRYRGIELQGAEDDLEEILSRATKGERPESKKASD